MAGISTGVNLLTVSGIRLIDKLEDYWELNTTTSYKGVSLATTSMSMIGTGVDGSANSAIVSASGGRARFHNLPAPASPVIKARTFVGWLSMPGNTVSIISSSFSSSYTSINFTNGSVYDIGGVQVGAGSSQTLLNKVAGGNLATYSFPAFTFSSGDNSYRFVVFSWEYVTLPSITYKLYTSSGTVGSSITQNLSQSFNDHLIMIGPPTSGNMATLNVIDKVATFNSLLKPEEIVFLYNSGAGRSITEIENFY